MFGGAKRDRALRVSQKGNKQSSEDEKAVNRDNKKRMEAMFRVRQSNSPRRENESENTIKSDGMTVSDQIPAPINITKRPMQRQDDDNIDELERAERNLLRKREIPPPAIRTKLLQRMKSDYFDALVCEDYDKAAQLEEASNFLSDLYECEHYVQMKAEEMKLVEERLAAAKKHLAEEQKRWAKIASVYNQEYTRDRRALLEKQAEERRAFETNWEDPSQLIQYKKASSELLFLRRQQKKLGLVKQYEEAKAVKRKADMLQITETENAEERVISAMQAAFEVLEEKHAKEIACFEEHQVRTKQYIEQERRKALHPIEKLIAQLETARDKDKPTNKKPTSVVFRSTRRTRVVRSERALPSASPRTTRAMCDFKAADDPPRLHINVKRIMSARRPISVVRSSVRR